MEDAIVAEEQRRIDENEKQRLQEIEEQKRQARIDQEVSKRQLEADERVREAEAQSSAERQEKAAEVAAIKKQNTLSHFNGHYENKQKMSASISRGSLDIKILSDDKLEFSLVNTMTSATCKVDNMEARLVYESNKKITAYVGNEAEAKRNRDLCYLELKFTEASSGAKQTSGANYFVVVEQQVGCKTYCERGGIMGGRYIK
jgi:hypothetical protein